MRKGLLESAVLCSAGFESKSFVPTLRVNCICFPEPRPRLGTKLAQHFTRVKLLVDVLSKSV
jgi:hypothetical protein